MKNHNQEIRTDGLKASGIANLYELIEACRSPDKRGELSALLGVSQARIEGWLELVYPNHESAVVREVASLLEHGGITVLKPGITRRNPD